MNARQPFAGVPITTGTVLPEWIDINNHMNVAYYVLAFDEAVDKLWNRFGMTEEHVRTRRTSTFAVESHVTYQGELQLGEPYVVTSQVVAYDEKRIHQFQRMYHEESAALAATCEWMNLHVDLSTRRVAPWTDELLDGIADFVAGQGDWPLPEELGRRMRVARPRYSAEEYHDER